MRNLFPVCLLQSTVGVANTVHTVFVVTDKYPVPKNLSNHRGFRGSRRQQAPQLPLEPIHVMENRELRL